MDVTSEMLHAARARLAGRAQIVQADLAEPLPFAAGSFDVVLSAFTLHYLSDWTKPLREFNRILRQRGGIVVLSVHHPFNDVGFAAGASYFQTAPATDLWVASDGTETTVHFYRRPLSAIVEALYETGFLVERMLEAPPAWLQGATNDTPGPFFVCLRALKR